MSSGRDEWMSGWSAEDKQRNLSSYLGQIPEEFGGPVKGVTGKKYEQLEFDFLDATDKQLDVDAAINHQAIWRLKNDVNNHIFQANAIIKLVMDSMGSSGGSANDDYEFALWGASELLQKAADLLE